MGSRNAVLGVPKQKHAERKSKDGEEGGRAAGGDARRCLFKTRTQHHRMVGKYTFSEGNGTIFASWGLLGGPLGALLGRLGRLVGRLGGDPKQHKNNMPKKNNFQTPGWRKPD